MPHPKHLIVVRRTDRQIGDISEKIGQIALLVSREVLHDKNGRAEVGPGSPASSALSAFNPPAEVPITTMSCPLT